MKTRSRKIARWSGMVLLVAIVALPCVTQADALYLRDGWDIVNNVADPGGYSGTADDTGKSNDYSFPGAYTGVDYLMIKNGSEATSSVVDFDLSGLGLSGATINSATLKMTISAGAWWKGATFVAKEADAAWTEGQTSYWKTTGNVLWNNWTSGMTMTGSVLDSEVVGQANTSTGRTGYVVTLDVTDTVQGWIDGNEQKGFAVMKTTSSLDNNANFAGKSYSTVEYRPMLEIDYTIPEPMTLSLVAIGLAGLAGRRRK